MTQAPDQPVTDLVKLYHEKIGGHKPSEFQAAIYHWIEYGRGDGTVNAVAGSGKSTTIVNGCKLLSGSAIFIAFSKKIVETLVDKLSGTTASAKTVHSIGYGMVAESIKPVRIKINEKKYNDLCRKWVDGNRDLDIPTKNILNNDDIFPDWTNSLLDLVHYCRCTLTDPYSDPQLGIINDALYEMVAMFGIETYGYLELLVKGIALVIRQGADMADLTGEIDYTDMIYLPYYWKLPALQTFQWVLVDEQQDLSACQLDLILKLRAAGGRYLLVGDPFQSIMGFAGADCDSFWKIKAALNATELPLSVNYRCPKSHIDAVVKVGTVPHIQAHDGAKEGVIRTITPDTLKQEVKEGDMILCRMNAPLISTAIDLIAARIPARVLGRDIGRELGSLAEKIIKRSDATFEKFVESVDAYEAKETIRLSKKKNGESAVQSLADKCECLRVIYTSSKADNLADLKADIDALFSEGRASVTLCTVHKSKGLENPRIFIINPESLPLRWPNQQKWQYQQELNLQYVAMTRAQEELIYVKEKPATAGDKLATIAGLV